MWSLLLPEKDVDRYKQCHKDIPGSKDMIQDPSGELRKTRLPVITLV